MAKVLDDLDGEARELTDLINELVELATDRRGDEPSSELVARRAGRTGGGARRPTHRPPVVVDADTGVVTGRPLMLERAITNLVDNAAKFDEGGEAPIEVVVRQGTRRGARSGARDRTDRSAPPLRPLLPRLRRAQPPRFGTRPGHREGRRRGPRRDRLRRSPPWWRRRRGLQGAGRVIPTLLLTSPGPALARPGHRDHRNQRATTPGGNHEQQARRRRPGRRPARRRRRRPGPGCAGPGRRPERCHDHDDTGHDGSGHDGSGHRRSGHRQRRDPRSQGPCGVDDRGARAAGCRGHHHPGPGRRRHRGAAGRQARRRSPVTARASSTPASTPRRRRSASPARSCGRPCATARASPTWPARRASTCRS